MTAIIDKSMVEGSAYLPSNGRNLDIPQQLLEINELLKSINTRLEDCALEWQAEISHLLQDETASDNKETRYTRNQFYDTTRNCKELNNNHTKSMQLLSLNHKHLNEERKIQDYINNISTVQNSFTDVLKAKLNFDTKFLGFEAVLHKATSTSTNIACFCQDCSNTVQSIHSKNRKLRNVTINQRNHTLTKTKRLTRLSKTLCKKRKNEKPSVVMADAGDQLFLETHDNFC